MKASSASPSRRKPVLTPDPIQAHKLPQRVLREGTKAYTVQRHRTTDDTHRFIDLYFVKK